MNKFLKIFITGSLVTALAVSLVACNTDNEQSGPTDNDSADQVTKPGTDSGSENNSNVNVGKLDATTLETYFRSYRVAFEVVAKENAGFNTFGWDIGDNAGGLATGDTIVINEKTYTYTNAAKDAGDRIRNSYDEGDINLNGIMDDSEEWSGRKVYTEKWTGNYTLDNPANPNDKSAYNALEHAINANLDPKFQIELSYDGTFTTLIADPWGTNFHGMFVTNALEDKTDRGALIILSDGPNKTGNVKVNIANGVISFTGNTDDFYLSTIYTFKNGYGEVVSDMKLPTVTENNDNEVDNNIGNVENNNNNNNSNNDNQSMQNKIEVVDIDWSKLVTIDFGKWNGYATPTLTVNYDYFETKILSKNVKSFLEKETSYGITRVIESECSNWFTVEFVEDYQNLSNGDKISAKIVLNSAFDRNGMSFEEFCKELGFNFTETTEFTVIGLQTDFIAVNFLEELISCIQYRGADGYVQVSSYPFIPSNFEYNVGDVYVFRGEYTNSVKIIYKNTHLIDIPIYANNASHKNLSKNDKIDLYFYYKEEVVTALEKLSDFGYVIPYTVQSDNSGYSSICKIMVDIPNRGEYLTSKEQLSENVVSELSNVLLQFTEDEYTYDKIYFAKYKPGVECPYDTVYCIIGVYFRPGWLYNGYTYDILYDVIVQPDGTIIYEASRSANTSGSYYTKIEGAENRIDSDGYEVIELIYSKPTEEIE